MGDITKNFSYSEFRPHSKPIGWVPDNEYQKMLLTKLAENLQIVRNHSPIGTSFKVTSGVREVSDYTRLINAGYNPSSTSDHYCGNPVPTNNKEKEKRFGPIYVFSSGAADIVPIGGMKVKQLFNLAFNLVKEGLCTFKQVIYEVDWVHFGNNPLFAFSPEVSLMLKKPQFMQSLNGGKTYTIVNEPLG